ncbi:envelope glycoprotein G [Human alphaherpesvirus 1]|nr:envelope glycoprotein G [Human alphaherpesvirus 1]
MSPGAMRAVVPIIPFLLVLVGVSGVPTNVSSTTQPQLQTTGRPSHEAPNAVDRHRKLPPPSALPRPTTHPPCQVSDWRRRKRGGGQDGEHLRGGDGTRDTLPQSPGPAVPLAGDDEKDKPSSPVVPSPGPNNSPARPETSRPKTPPTSIGPLATRPTTQLPSKGRPLVPTPQHTPLFSFLTASPALDTLFVISTVIHTLSFVCIVAMATHLCGGWSRRGRRTHPSVRYVCLPPERG